MSIENPPGIQEETKEIKNDKAEQDRDLPKDGVVEASADKQKMMDKYYGNIHMIMGSAVGQSELYKIIVKLTPSRKKNIDSEKDLQADLATALTTFQTKLKELRKSMSESGLSSDEMGLIDKKVISDTVANYKQYAGPDHWSDEQQKILDSAFIVEL